MRFSVLPHKDNTFSPNSPTPHPKTHFPPTKKTILAQLRKFAFFIHLYVWKPTYSEKWNTNCCRQQTEDRRPRIFDLSRRLTSRLQTGSQAALSQAFDYVDAVIKKDVSRVDRVNRNSTTTRLLLRSYARNQGSQATIGTIVADMSTNDENEISIKLLYRPIYLHCHFRPWSKRPTERPQHDGAVFRSTLRARPSCICRCHW